MYVRVNDTVQILTGDDAGVQAKVLKVLRDENKVVVEGVNRVYKHLRRSQRNPQGGRLSKEMPVSLSNVMIVCQSCGQASRFGGRYAEDGSKERYCKKCGSAGGQLSPPRTAYAKK